MKKKLKQSSTELQKLFAEADKTLDTLKLDIDGIMSLMKKIQDVEYHIGELNRFYHSDIWPEGREKILVTFPEKHFNSAGEDTIWDISQRWYYLRLKLNKILADSLFNEVPDDLK